MATVASRAFEEPSVLGMKEFLRSLPEDEVHGILKTTSAGLIAAASVEEAISLITRYSDAVTLLNRRRVKKEYLIGYLGSKRVPFSLTADKTKLCRAILDHWGKQDCNKLKFADLPIRKESKPNQQVLNQTAASQSTVSRPAESKKIEERKPNPEVPKPIILTGPPAPSQSVAGADNTQLAVATINNAKQLVRDDDDEEEAMDFEQSLSLRRHELEVGQQLGEQFGKWFYENLNSHADFGPQHFWPDCNLRIEYDTNITKEIKNVKEVICDGTKCFEEMSDLITSRRVFFNPNLIPGIGIRGKITPHGLAHVIVCGTVLQLGNVMGVFEQVFGLMMDPAAENNYKIRFSMLRLREQSYIAKNDDPPELCNTSICGLIDEID